MKAHSVIYRMVVHAIAAAALVSVAGIASTALAAVGGKSGGDTSATNNASVDTGSALVQLKGDPLSTYVKTQPAHGKKIDFNSATVKSYRAQLSAQRNDFKAWLRANAPRARVTSQYDLSLNAVAVELNGESLATIAAFAFYRGCHLQTTNAFTNRPASHANREFDSHSCPHI